MKHYRVLSPFDGISCGQEALNRVIGRNQPYTWYASEVDNKAMDITNHNYPNTIQVGDIRELKAHMFPYTIDIIMGGSPCQDFSSAGKKEGMEVTTLKEYLRLKKQGFEFKGESHLFWEFVRLINEIKPKYFLLENVVMKGKSKMWVDIISNALGVKPIRINSNLVSAQNRDRLYWTNIPNVTVPEDKGIILSDVIPGATNGYGFGGVPNSNGVYEYPWTERKDHKSACLTRGGNRDYVMFDNDTFRKLTPEEYEILQTLPAGYTNVPGVSKTNRRKAIGNGWTVDVIKHILSFIPELKKQNQPELTEIYYE